MSTSDLLLKMLDISNADIQQFTDSNPGLCGVEISRMSQLLLAQLTAAYKKRLFNTFCVTDVIQELENLSRPRSAKEAEQFRGPVLRGLWKAHFVLPTFILKNIYNEWRIFSEKSNRFDELCRRVVAAEESSPSSTGWQGRLAHEFVMGGYEKRASANKLTGEWIVFAKDNGRNIYLCLSKHTSGPDEDTMLLSMLREFCSEEFPDLFPISK